MKKRVSSFSAIYIMGGLLYIVFLLYYIGTQMQRVHNTNLIYLEKEQELTNLKNTRNRVMTKKNIMTTAEHADRRNKENFGILADGEKEYILPAEFYNKQQTPAQIFIPENIPIQEQWKNIFFPKT